MARFYDAYAPEEMPGYPCGASPRFSTTITVADSGDEQANRNWVQPLWRFTLPKAVRTAAQFEAVKTHFLAMAGPAYTWPWRNPLDCASVGVADPPKLPAITALDQVLGTGDGVRVSFPLIKTYARGPRSESYRIYLPVTSSVLVSVNGVTQSTGWSVTRAAGPSSGVVVFDAAPAPGQVVRAGYYYDKEVRFEADDSLDTMLADFGAAGFADLTLIEVRPC